MAIVDANTPMPTGIISRVRVTPVLGGSAGDHTLTGIQDGFDKLIAVLRIGYDTGTPANGFDVASDILSEFTITADDTINNTGGTDTSTDLLLVFWYDADWGMTSDPGFAG